MPCFECVFPSPLYSVCKAMHFFSLFYELVWVWLFFWEVEMIGYLAIFIRLLCRACSLNMPVQLCAETHWFTVKTKLLAQSVWARERERERMCVNVIWAMGHPHASQWWERNPTRKPPFNFTHTQINGQIFI